MRHECLQKFSVFWFQVQKSSDFFSSAEDLLKLLHRKQTQQSQIKPVSRLKVKPGYYLVHLFRPIEIWIGVVKNGDCPHESARRHLSISLEIAFGVCPLASKENVFLLLYRHSIFSFDCFLFFSFPSKKSSSPCALLSFLSFSFPATGACTSDLWVQGLWGSN